MVRDLVSDLAAEAAERTVPATVRETVDAVRELTAFVDETTVTALAAALNLDKSAMSRRVGTAVSRGYLKNLQDRRGKPARLVLGDPLPAEQQILPSVEVLHGCSAAAGGYVDRDADPEYANDGWAE